MKNRNFKGIYVKLNVVNDRDILERLDQVSNKQGYIKRLIREDTAFEHFCDEAFKNGGEENGNQQEGET